MLGQLKDRVPKKFSSTDPLLSHEFNVIDPRSGVYEQIETIHGEIKNIEPSVYCKLRKEGGVLLLLIPYRNSPKLANSILSLASLPRNGNRQAKYLELYQIYEGLQNNVNPNLAALRNALSHPPEKLTNPKTVSRMNEIFGSVFIDLGNTKDERIFWRLFSELLIAVDNLIGDLLSKDQAELMPPPEYKRVITPAYLWMKENAPDLFEEP